jgi:hypothetical protein
MHLEAITEGDHKIGSEPIKSVSEAEQGDTACLRRGYGIVTREQSVNDRAHRDSVSANFRHGHPVSCGQMGTRNYDDRLEVRGGK